MINTIPAALNQRSVLTHVFLVIGGSAIIAISAQIAIPIPFTPVPLTMSPLAVLLIGIALGSRRGAAAAVLYLLEGLSGLPVGAQGHGGPLWLIGPTAGYLYAYPFAAYITGWFSERGFAKGFTRAFVAMLIALAVIYLGGWSWLAIIIGPRAAFTMAIVPFVVADLAKIAIGAALLPYAQRLIANLTSS